MPFGPALSEPLQQGPVNYGQPNINLTRVQDLTTHELGELGLGPAIWVRIAVASRLGQVWSSSSWRYLREKRQKTEREREREKLYTPTAYLFSVLVGCVYLLWTPSADPSSPVYPLSLSKPLSPPSSPCIRKNLLQIRLSILPVITLLCCMYLQSPSFMIAEMSM